MYILGAVTSGHDSAVCLLKDGEVVSAISDKRLSRIKYRFENNSIRKSLEYVLSYAGIDINDIGLIVCDTDYVYPNQEPPQEIFPDFKNKHNIVQVNHHLGHASSCFFPSPFKEAAVLTLDACGGIAPIVEDKSSWGRLNSDIEFQARGFIPAHQYRIKDEYVPESESISLLLARRGEKIRELDNYFVDSSLGFFYGHMSHYLYMEEGELMGLSGYGKKSALYDTMQQVIELLPEGRIRINKEYINFWNGRAPLNPSVDLSYLTGQFYTAFGPKRKLHEALTEHYMDFAYAVQKRVEDAIVHIANHLYNLTRCENICIAGGVGLNSIANHKILEQTPFKYIWIQPAATDDGIALGNALFGYYVFNKLPKDTFFQMNHAYTGKPYSSDEIENLLYSYKEEQEIPVTYYKDSPYVTRVYLKWQYDEENAYHTREMLYIPKNKEYRASIPVNHARRISYYFETECN